MLYAVELDKITVNKFMQTTLTTHCGFPTKKYNIWFVKDNIGLYTPFQKMDFF